ncbi:cytoplasmic protein [Luteolibacter arcticus]|uniref:Cytoplasmic protein n=1 Tax=Luteolibacter arcticus TaxID=1581411 RepID=A0ABT3GRV6_9BACT|nr:cytoplasmic protein [Luteolibacter arcticus]MCW1926235.1 cytoplasmic protein [Luteolibacter arcticus]
MSADDPDAPPFIAAHRHSSNHREELLRSATCGCFHCLRIFTPSTIEEWVDEIDGVGITALCPACGIDSVVGEASRYPITTEFLKTMSRHWFGRE